MPKVPGDFNTGAEGVSPAAQPSATHTLMALAEMHQQGNLADPQPTMPKGSGLPAGSPSGRPHKAGRKLKVVK